MKYKIILIILAIIFNGTIYSAPKYKPLTVEQITKSIGSNVRNSYSLQGMWNKKAKNGIEKVYVPYTEYNCEEIEYSKTFSLDSITISNKNIFICFLGIAGSTELYINDNFVTKVSGNSLPYYINIPNNLLKSGNNDIRMKFLPENNVEKMIYYSFIDKPKRFMGIFREPLLVVANNIFIKSVSTKDNGNKINVRVSIQAENNKNNSQKYFLEWKIKPNNDANTIIKSELTEIKLKDGRISNINFEFNKNIITAWTFTAPNTYSLELYIKDKNNNYVDDRFINIANKSIKIENKQVVFNNEPQQLLCMDYDECFAGVGYTRTLKSIENDIKKMKSLGVNTIILSKNNPDKILLDICDVYGVNVILSHSVPLLAEGLTNDDYAYCKNLFLYKLETYNNPCVIGIYLEGNSNIINNNKYVSIGHQNGLLVFSNSNKILDADVLLMKTTGNNEQTATILMGSSAITGEIFNDPQSILFDRQSIYHQNLYNKVYKSNNFAGYCVQSFYDYSTEYPLYYLFNTNPSINQVGLIGINNNERPLYSIVQQLYLNEKQNLLSVYDFKIDNSLFYLIFSIVLVLILSYLLKTDPKLYTLFHRSLRRGHNLYNDIRDGRLSYSIGIYILLLLEVLSISMGLSIYIRDCLESIAFSHFMLLAIPNRNILLFLSNIFYSEPLLLAVFFFLFALLGGVLMIYLRILFQLYNIRISYRKLYYLLAFLFSPLCLLALLSILLGKLLFLSNIVSILFIILLFILFISLFKRLIESISILLDKSTLQISLVLIGSFALLVVLPLYFYFKDIGTFFYIIDLIF